MIRLLPAEMHIASFQVGWMELLLLGIGVLLTLGMLTFFVILIIRSRDKS